MTQTTAPRLGARRVRRLATTAGGWLAVGLAAAGCASHQVQRTADAGPPPRPTRAGGCSEGDTVLVGYGSQRRCTMTGAVSSLTVGAEGARGMPTMAEVLRGRVPGLDVFTNSTGQISLRVRGATSFLAGTEPLLVVDGTPVEGAVGAALASIAPQDVARVDVLKDATAAVYGSRGANGVVLITTRKR